MPHSAPERQVLECEKVKELHDARKRPIRIGLAEELSAQVVVCACPGYLQNILRQSSGDDPQEMLMRIEILDSRILAHLTVVHDDSEAHDQGGPYAPVPMHDMKLAMGCLAQAWALSQGNGAGLEQFGA